MVYNKRMNRFAGNTIPFIFSLKTVLLFLLIQIIPFNIFVKADEIQSWSCQTYPSESRTIIDAHTGVPVQFVTTHSGNDTNLYFHTQSWLANESMLIFMSDREGKQEAFGYILQTGELIRLATGDNKQSSGFLAAKKEKSIFLTKEDGVYEWKIDLTFKKKAGKSKSAVSVSEHKIGDFPPNVKPGGALNENLDCTKLALILVHNGKKQCDIVFIDKATGEISILASVNWRATHLQCSWTQPDLVMFARTYPIGGDRVPLMSDEEYAARSPRARFWFADSSEREPWTIYFQKPGELVTHECWWIQDQISFCGGFLPEESHLKVIDYKTGVVRIAGAGSWWPDGTSSELVKRNWWHASGSPSGKWLAADNWHGDIMLFNARTTEMQPLTMGHRTYGSGAHPHVGWSPSGDKVVFTSNRLGNPDVCVVRVQ